MKKEKLILGIDPGKMGAMAVITKDDALAYKFQKDLKIWKSNKPKF